MTSELARELDKRRFIAVTLEMQILAALRVNRNGLHFNEIYRWLKTRRMLGSYTTLSNTLKRMLSQDLIKVTEKKKPGLQKRIYRITDKGMKEDDAYIVVAPDLVRRLIEYRERIAFKGTFDELIHHLLDQGLLIPRIARIASIRHYRTDQRKAKTR